MNEIINRIRTEIEKIIDPSLKKPLKETEGIKHIGYDAESDVVTLIVGVGEKTPELEKDLKLTITKLVKLDLGHKGIKLQIEEHRQYNSIVNSSVRFIGIISGKGGVGKSTVAANIAYRLAKKGHKVGIIDADIYGSSIPNLLEFDPSERPFYNNEGKITPLVKENIETISTEFFTKPSEPVIWRGGMLHSMLDHFFYDVAWSKKMEYMLIDLPPGTGDIMLDIKSYIPQAKMILVTTPHPSASHVAIKAGYAAQKLEHEILGIVENMSYYYNEANKKNEKLFGEGGGQMVASSLGAELICQIPINQPLHHVSLYESDEQIGSLYDDIADYIIMSYEKL